MVTHFDSKEVTHCTKHCKRMFPVKHVSYCLCLAKSGPQSLGIQVSVCSLCGIQCQQKVARRKYYGETGSLVCKQQRNCLSETVLRQPRNLLVSLRASKW